MVDFFVYLLRSGVCLAGFHLIYGMAFRKSTFFTLNRIYLACGLVLSFVIPLLKIPLPEIPATGPLPGYVLPFDAEAMHGMAPQTLRTAAQAPVWPMALAVIYCCGIALSLLRHLLALRKILRIKNNASTVSHGRWKIFESDGIQPFSFFGLIFLPPGPADPLVLEHEKAHVRGRHWIDLLLLQIASLLLWFNPLVALYGRSVKLQHEYLADRAAASEGGQTADYLRCMLRQTQAVSLGALASRFHQKTTKNRITMITKNRTSRTHAWLYLLILPLVATLTLGFASRIQAHPAGEDAPAAVKSAAKPAIPSGYPLKKEAITGTASYGDRKNPITGQQHMHRGMDFAAAEGTEISSTADGVVQKAEYCRDRQGNVVVIKHGDRYSTLYSHMQKSTVTAGQTVTQGQLIGYVGNTGRSTGPHLHYEILDGTQPVDPATYLH